MKPVRSRKLVIIMVALGLFLSAAGPKSSHNLPKEAYISGVVGYAQSLALSCESRSAADLLAFWGLSVSEINFFNSLPTSDDPDRGFVGSVHGAWGNVPPNPYGVHPFPVAENLKRYGLNAQAQRGMNWDDLRAEIAAGRPAIVWVIGGVWSGESQTYTAQDGRKTTVARYEHTMILIGYDEYNVYLVDAGTGYNQTHAISNFLKSWAVLENRAVTAVRNNMPQPTPDTSQGETYVVKPGDYLSNLADQWGISWQDLAALNNIIYPYVIIPGQILFTGQNTSQPDPTNTPAPTQIPQTNPTAAATQENSPATAVPTNTPMPTDQPTESENKPTPKQKTYTVKKGEHLMQIAREQELDWVEIAEINQLRWPYTLYPNQVLVLPGTDAGNPPPPPATVPEPNPPRPDKSGEKYTVQKGDYLYTLAQNWGVNWQVVATTNGIGYPFIIYPGQVLQIP